MPCSRAPPGSHALTAHAGTASKTRLLLACEIPGRTACSRMAPVVSPGRHVYYSFLEGRSGFAMSLTN